MLIYNHEIKCAVQKEGERERERKKKRKKKTDCGPYLIQRVLFIEFFMNSLTMGKKNLTRTERVYETNERTPHQLTKKILN